MIQEVGDLTGQGFPGRGPRPSASLGVVLGGDQDFGRLLGHLSTDEVDAALEKL